MKNLTDEQIIESIKKGNKGDFTLLVDRYKDKGFSLLKRILKNDLDAEEALQDTFMKVFSSLNSFRFESKFSTWFYKVTFNTGLTMAASKKRKIEKEMSSIEDHFELGHEDERIYSESENVKQYVMKLVDHLPPRNALLLILFYIDDMSLKEISDILEISLVNTKVLLHRSRNILRDMLLKHNYQEEVL
ncbi:MAG: sigma-70 family RNA polymerase sigma factor [Melioribacteraceae bacterium]|nr:sigma-70 family RNA polymerase sigma factor [Melioribacteraceae bacterium]WKZ68690.1 MAG: sigma-70 family RNA polymerase sigma factor [Melioribacteraceae bacterium]